MKIYDDKKMYVMKNDTHYIEKRSRRGWDDAGDEKWDMIKMYAM